MFRCRGDRPVAPTPGNTEKICCHFAHNFIRKVLETAIGDSWRIELAASDLPLI